ncbi:MAG: hypothetical protein CMO55_09185 [Verrucomicrobiales bacterium]|nr:hypothetical protein [Verrucomicrobiales bacterium]
MSWNVHSEITGAKERLGGLKLIFDLLPDHEQESLLLRIKARFLEIPSPRWWWEHLKLPQRTLEGVTAMDLPVVCPDREAVVWLIPCDEKNELIYQTTPVSAKEVLGECFLFEYAIVAEDLAWLMIENHHGEFVVTGDLEAGS